MTAKQAEIARKTSDWIEANSDWQSALSDPFLDFAGCIAKANGSQMMLWLMTSEKMKWMTGGRGFKNWYRHRQHRRIGIDNWALTKNKLDSMDIDIDQMPKILRSLSHRVNPRKRKNLLSSAEIENIITESLDLEIWLDISCIPINSSGDGLKQVFPADMFEPLSDFKKYTNIRSSHSDIETWLLADKIAKKIAETLNGEFVFVAHFKRSQNSKPYQNRILTP